MSSREPLKVDRPSQRPDHSSLRRRIPSVHELVESLPLARWADRLPRQRIVETARMVLTRYREELASLESTDDALTLAQLAEQVAVELEASERPALRPVINATGIILHTGLGRAPLATSAAAALSAVAGRYANVEIELETGQRGQRVLAVRELLCKLTGAESAVVVNNNAAATLIVLATVAGTAGDQVKNVVVSRSELIEIGGSFRLPEIMKASGAGLREVGTTNKTRRTDYERAIDTNTAALMKIHPSNYRIVGFTESVSIGDLVELGHARGLAVIHDIGSGAMIDFERFGLHDEPVAADSVAAGADLVLFSGDKLLGGPQAGIILGRQAWVEKVEQNPWMRPLRVDKITLASLEATLRLHRDGNRVVRELPVLAMAGVARSELERRGHEVVVALRSIEHLTELQVTHTTAYLGGGAMPGQGVDSAAVRLRTASMSEDELARRLRTGDPAVIPRVQDGMVWLDLRTVLPDQDADLARAVRAACGVT